MVKYVLQNIGVYWFSLNKVSWSILKAIRQKIHGFIWPGKNFQKLHLVNGWKLDAPYKFGGWTIKNICHFSPALLLKSLLRDLMSESLWSMVVKDKYLQGRSVSTWLRSVKKKTKGVSNICAGLLSTLPILDDWVAWMPGDGHQIQMVPDPILGGPSVYKISRELIFVLRAHGYCSL